MDEVAGSGTPRDLRDALPGTRPGSGGLARVFRIMSNLMAILVLALLARKAFGDVSLTRSARLVLTAGSSVTAATLLLVNLRLQADALAQRRDALRTGLELGALAGGVVLFVTYALGEIDAAAIGVALTSFVLVAVFGACATLLEWLGARPALAANVTLSLAAGATTSPLWLGPIAELSRMPAVVDGVIAASPLTFLAVVADLDYPRNVWFYQHTAIGSLRYQYPPAWLLFAAYSLLPLAAFWVGRHIEGRRGTSRGTAGGRAPVTAAHRIPSH